MFYKFPKRSAVQPSGSEEAVFQQQNPFFKSGSSIPGNLLAKQVIGPTPALLNRRFWDWSPTLYLPRLPGHCDASPSLRIIA